MRLNVKWTWFWPLCAWIFVAIVLNVVSIYVIDTFIIHGTMGWWAALHGAAWGFFGLGVAGFIANKVTP